MPNESIVTQLLRRKRFDNNMMNLDQNPSLSNPATALPPMTQTNPLSQPMGQNPSSQSQPSPISPQLIQQLQMQAARPGTGIQPSGFSPQMSGSQPGMQGGMPGSQMGGMPSSPMGGMPTGTPQGPQQEPYSQLEMLLSRLGLIQLPKQASMAMGGIRG